MSNGGTSESVDPAGELQELRAALKSARDAQSLLETVLDSAREFAIVAADANNKITLWSAGAERLFICSESDIRGEHGARILASLTADSEPPLTEVFSRAMAKGSYDADFQAMTKRQRPFPANIAARPWRDESGQAVGVVAVVQDLTQRVETLQARDAAVAEARLAREAALVAAQAKADFLANMSHEIRTPMNAVMGMLQLVSMTPLNDQQADYIDKAQSAATGLLRIIDDILDFSKIEAGMLALSPERFEVDALLREIAAILGANVGGKFVEILFDVDPQLPRVLHGDSHRLRQVLINLAGNALKFTDQGEVVLKVRRLPDNNHDPQAVHLNFSVSDSGIGMTVEQQQGLFQAFSQAEAGTSRRFGGTGLGLVISKRLIELMGGKLKLESTPGVGSRFYFDIPMQAVADATDLLATPVDIEELRDLQVLIVDDNDSSREILSGIAQSLGWETSTAAGGKEALRIVEDRKRENKPFQVAFVDWAMPGMDGWETAQALRELLEESGMPMVVMVTAHAREALERRRREAQDLISGFLMKPVTASDLFDAVANTLVGGRAASISRSPYPQSRLRDFRLLLVEDNLTNQQIACELLGHEGAVVEVANSGMAAITALQADPGGFDAVLMDVQMPGMDGYTATRKIRGELGLSKLPIIAMTANVMQSDREAGFEAGMNAYVGKPYYVDTIVSTVLEQCGHNTARAAPPRFDSSLSSPPGFDFNQALQRLGNNQGLFAKQAQAFSDRCQDDFQGICVLIGQGNLAAAARELHTMKGLAGTLGSETLASQLKACETAINEAAGSEALAERLEAVRPLLADSQLALSVVAQELSESCGESHATPIVEAIAPEQLQKGLGELESLLQASNMRALKVFSELSPQLTGLPAADLANVSDALESLDFTAALHALGTLRAHLK